MAINFNATQFATQNAFNALRSNTEKVNQALSQSLNKTLPGNITIGPKQSAETTAKNILGFVANGLNALRSQGASEERIQQRWAEAQKGIEKGYKDAIGMLKGLGLYDSALESEVEAGRSLVNEGMEKLRVGENPFTQSSVESVAQAVKMNTSNAMKLEVKTRDGDIVKVTFHQLAGKNSNSSIKAEGWSMDVQGDLSKAERDALTSLFNDVQSLSERFFSGDIAGALEEAMQLGYDGNQLASFSLDLTQRMEVPMLQTYATERTPLPTSNLENNKALLASYVDSYERAIEKANALQEPMKLFSDLVQQMFPTESRLSIWEQFHNGLNQQLAK